MPTEFDAWCALSPTVEGPALSDNKNKEYPNRDRAAPPGGPPRFSLRSKTWRWHQWFVLWRFEALSQTSYPRNLVYHVRRKSRGIYVEPFSEANLNRIDMVEVAR